jgi:phage tail-like protein
MALERKDPYASFRFKVEIDSLDVSGFSEATGLSFETDVETFREGGENTHERQLAGPSKFPARLILKRGLADADALWSWYQDVMSGRIKRRTVKIKLLDPDPGNDELDKYRWQWVFREACPVKWSGPEFRAGNAEVAFESIELVHRGIEPSPESGRKK